MEIVRRVAGDVSGESSYQVPGNLRAIRERCRSAKRGAGEEAAHIHLIVGRTYQLVIAIATVEMPFCAEVVIHTNHAEVVALRYGEVGFESLNVNAVAADAQQRSAARIVWHRQVLVPELLHQRIDTASNISCRARIAGIQIEQL